MNNNYLRKTKIVCTIGPASEDKLVELMNAGMDVVRINFSHGSYPEQESKVMKFFEARKKVNKPVVTVFADDNKKYLSTDLSNEIDKDNKFISNKIKLLDYEVI